MRYASMICGSVATVLWATAGNAQAPGITPEMIRTALPLEGAPRATHGPYDVLAEPAFESARHVVYRPSDLRAFPNEDSLPVLVWGNGGCALNSAGYRGFLTTVASQGFVAIATAVIEGEEPRRANAEDLRAAIDWIEAENAREESPLRGKVATDAIAVMGTSCGGFMAIELGSDPRVDTIGVFNSGVQDADREDRSPTAPTPAMLSGLHGPVLLVNGHERDFMMDESQATFDAIDHLPVFYGARHDAGHTATVFHPGGGEFANVAANWLRLHLKSDRQAGEMFLGPRCELCTNDDWDTDSKGLSFAAVQSAVTERVVMRHLAASEAGDASVVPRDYASDAIVIFGSTATSGIDGVQRVFEDLYARTKLELNYTTRVFEQDVGYVVWTMGNLRGSDTFIVRDGKISAQTGIVFRTE
jgi:dienelactone hydrolase/ketosteroid isomerase-like protein